MFDFEIWEELTSTKFYEGFAESATAVIVLSEVGDDSFFIAVIMAMRHPRLPVFLGASIALILMSVVSVGFGYLASAIPRRIVFYTAKALFTLFGLKMLWKGFRMKSHSSQGKMDRVNAELQKLDDVTCIEGSNQPITPMNEPSTNQPDVTITELGMARKKREERSMTGGSEISESRRYNIKEWSQSFWQAFTMTFLTEWGDSSQVTTFLLAAEEDIYGVMAGGALGHVLCTGVAVICGRFVAKRISVRTVTIICGVVFLAFSLYAFTFRNEDFEISYNASTIYRTDV